MTKIVGKKIEKEIETLHNLIKNLDKKITSSENLMPTHIEKSLKNESLRNLSTHNRKSFEDMYKQKLVGNLPFVLLDKLYFPTNDLLVKFAQKNLKLNIKFAKSKSRDALIGSIIVEAVKKDPEEIRKFYQAIERIIGKNEEVGVKDFFGEWNKIIKTL